MKGRKSFFISAAVSIILFAIVFAVVFELIQTRSQNAPLFSWPQDEGGTPASFFAAWGGALFIVVVVFLLLKNTCFAMYKQFKDPLKWQGGDAK